MSVQRKIIIYICLISAVFIISLPTLSMLGTSFKSAGEILTSHKLLPSHFTIVNYQKALKQAGFGINIRNSLIYAVTVTALCLFVASMGGYAVSRFKNPEFRGFAFLLLIYQMFPAMLFIIPLNLLFKKLGLLDTPYSVILGYLSSSLPFSIWMLKGYFDNIPTSMEESAMMDGCSHYQTLFKIIYPVSLPGMAAVAIFTFIRVWNEYLLASILLQSEKYMTLTVGLQKFVQEFQIDWGGLSAASSLSIVPSLIFMLFFSKVPHFRFNLGVS